MRVIETIKEMRTVMKAARVRGAAIVLVPTMGGLHGGHLSLVKRARQLAGEGGVVVASIFVNPAQFGKGEDLGAYPCDFERDAALLEQAGVQFIFRPTVGEIYPDGFTTSVDIGKEAQTSITTKLCGGSRHGHFGGVATVVTKLFNIVTPDVAVFGEKDYQQQLVIKKLVRDLDMDIVIETAPTVRDKDGLAMSSRNAYMDKDARNVALCVPRALDRACEVFAEGVLSVEAVKQEMQDVIEASTGTLVDYISISEPETLAEATELRSGLLVAVAVRVALTCQGGGTAVAESVRLIDNCMLDAKHVKITG